MVLPKFFGIAKGWPLAPGQSTSAPPPVPEPQDIPAGVLAKAWGTSVWSLGKEGNAGPRTPPTKLATDTGLYPPGASLAGQTITLGGSGGVFEGFLVSGYTIAVSADGWTIQDNILKGYAGASYDVNTNRHDTVVRYNDLDGDYGRLSNTGVSMSGAARGAKVYSNRFLNYLSDAIKTQSSVTDEGRPEIYENLITVGGWSEAAGPHFDAITVANGGADIHHNLLDLTSYISPFIFDAVNNPQPVTPPFVANSPPASAPPSYFTWGLTNAIRIQGQNGSAVDQVSITQNILMGHRRGGPNVLQVAPPEPEEVITYGLIAVSDNVLEAGYRDAIFHPNNAGDATIVFDDNVRLSDGAAFTTMFGATGVVPDAPVIGPPYFDQTTPGSVRVIFDRAPGAPYPGVSHEFAISTTGADGDFSPWTTLPTTHVIPDLDPATEYWVKLRGTNGYGPGAESNVASATTLEGSPSIFLGADNAATAWSRVASLPADANVRKIAILLDVQVDTANAGRYFLDNAAGSGTYVNMPAAGQLRAQIQGSSVTRATATYAPPAGESFRMVWTFDYTVPGTADGGALSDGVKLTIDGVPVAVSGTVHDTQNGARVLSIATFLANLGIMATGTGASIMDGRIKALAVTWGDATLSLPDISTEVAFNALFDDAHIEATLATWKLFYATSLPGAVGAPDGSTPNTWNATGGLDNRGTVPSKPAVKQAGVFT